MHPKTLLLTTVALVAILPLAAYAQALWRVDSASVDAQRLVPEA